MVGRADYYSGGDWNAVCFFCGFKFKASTLRKHWQGFYVCSSCWEPRQPQDFVRARVDVQTPPWVQPPSDTFLFGDPLITEQSSLTENLDYILTEDFYPITTE